MQTETDKGATEATTKNPQKSEEIFFKKPNEPHRFVFCSFCGVAQRSDHIARHFKIWHIAGSENTLKKGQFPLVSFTKRWENYVKKCITTKRTISIS